jgi:superfamily II DNA or RNA helicase
VTTAGWWEVTDQRGLESVDDLGKVSVVPSLSLTIAPSGSLRVDHDPPGPAPLDEAVAARVVQAFASGEGAGLLHLGAVEVQTPLPPGLGYFRDLGRGFVARVCQLTDPEGELAAGGPALDEATQARLLLNLPPLRGAEYVDAARVRQWWASIGQALADPAVRGGASVAEFLRSGNPLWNMVGRVHFHLAENKRDQARPFAFLATYTTGIAERGKVQHAPLGQALKQYAGARNKEALLSLLSPVSRAAERCAWVAALMESGALYQPLAWTPSEALALLRDSEALEAAGLVVRVPEPWRGQRPPRAQVSVTIGRAPGSGVGAEALVDFDVAVALDGEQLGEPEIRELLAATEGLVMLRGRWVEVDRANLSALLSRWREAEQAHEQGLPFHEALRLLAGASLPGPAAELLEEAREGSVRVVPGPWIAAVLDGLRSPQGLAAADPGTALRAQLRPYQQTGTRWLWWLRSLGLGGCLADDMGLGKTIQVIALLVLCRRQRDRAPASGGPSLVVAPASLLGNWRSELERFAPHLRILVAHTSETPAADLAQLTAERLAAFDVVLTSYGTLPRVEILSGTSWDLVIADEAQALKNAGTRQARAMRALVGRTRLALTGTPVENRLGDLWSIFSFSTPGLLGSAREFSTFVKGLEARAHDTYGPLRALVAPYVLRRLKTQKEVIADLPDKTEVKASCGLTRKQTALYQQAVDGLKRDLAAADGMKRKGVVLACLMRLKQICNHPAHWLGQGETAWDAADSGKLQRLGELVEEIAERQEKVLVFTQFKEATLPLAAHLARCFGRPGLVLSGETAIRQRQKMVEEFQAEDGPPFFVLSLRAGGTGLTLTAANHVIHFDRWWNPAVEDQATDRAFRIGQKRAVLVHKLVCRGTLEERIDDLIESKRKLARQVVEGDAEVSLTELSNEEVLRLVSLDLRTAPVEGS